MTGTSNAEGELAVDAIFEIQDRLCNCLGVFLGAEALRKLFECTDFDTARRVGV